MANVVFEDYSIQVEEALNAGVIKGLIEAAAEIKTQAVRNSRKDKGHLRGSWEVHIDEDNQEAIIGSPLENAVWEEFGTGEYALKEKSAPGYWVYVKGSGAKNDHKNKRYSLAEAKWIVKKMREDGLDAYYTNGKKPTRALANAFIKKRGIAVKLIERAIKEAME